jgi:hypothetical protein
MANPGTLRKKRWLRRQKTKRKEHLEKEMLNHSNSTIPITEKGILICKYKKQFSSYNDAVLAKLGIDKFNRRNGKYKTKQIVYQCNICTRFHLTTAPTDAYAPLVKWEDVK